MGCLCAMVRQEVWHGDFDSVRVGAAIGYSRLVQIASVHSFPLLFSSQRSAAPPLSGFPSRLHQTSTILKGGHTFGRALAETRPPPFFGHARPSTLIPQDRPQLDATPR